MASAPADRYIMPETGLLVQSKIYISFIFFDIGDIENCIGNCIDCLKYIQINTINIAKTKEDFRSNTMKS